MAITYPYQRTSCKENTTVGFEPQNFKMNISELENLDFQIIDVENFSLSIFKIQGVQFGILMSFYVIFALITITGEAMIIYYIQKYSPKEQSINKMILVDQVCKDLIFWKCPQKFFAYVFS